MDRVGIGQDSHRFSKTRKALVLGGVTVAMTGGFSGNSDGDVILHSLCNALSSAIGGDSLSTWSDAMCRAGINDSKAYVEEIAKRIKKAGFEVKNVSISVEAKKPFVDLRTSAKMKEVVAAILGVTRDEVGITFSSGEGLTPFGKGLGLQAISIVLLKKLK